MPNVLATLDEYSLLLAQGATATEGETSESTEESSDDSGGGGGGLFGSPIMLLVLGMVVIWIFLLGGGSRKQRKRQQEMLAGMSKGSKIVTIGGIKGSVVEIREDEVIVKVDENSNTRMKFSRDAIRTVVDENAGKDSSKEVDNKSKDKDKDKD